jgi:thiamine biosynthesis lipoprotein
MAASTTMKHAEPVMGTVVSFAVEAKDSTRAAELAIAASVAEIHRLAALLTTFEETSPMSRYRRGLIGDAELPREIVEVLELCSEVKRLTGGWFDPWALEGGVDPTGLSKGWIIERAVEVLARCGVRSALVNAGGDIATTGGPFTVGIQHPWHEDRLACAVVLAPGTAVATSGRYQRGDHLKDPTLTNPLSRGPSSHKLVGHPHGGLPKMMSVTVCGPSLSIADGLATALAVTSDDPYLITEAVGDEYHAYMIHDDGTEENTMNFPFAEAATAAGAES